MRILGAIVIKILLEEKYISKSTFKNKKLLSVLLACNSISIREERPAKIYLNDEKALLGMIKANGYNVTSLKDKIGATYNSDIWKKYSDICVNCGACTFNCPTCTCFDSIDTMCSKNDGCHYRTWDTCQNFAFTLHASGHNPRSTSEERLRQRVLHKYHYTVVQMDQFSCTGCGRCTQSCPVGISMLAILKDIKEVVDNGEK